MAVPFSETALLLWGTSPNQRLVDPRRPLGPVLVEVVPRDDGQQYGCQNDYGRYTDDDERDENLTCRVDCIHPWGLITLIAHRDSSRVAARLLCCPYIIT